MGRYGVMDLGQPTTKIKALNICVPICVIEAALNFL